MKNLFKKVINRTNPVVILLLIVFCPRDIYGQENFIDSFSVQAYDNNEGTLNWTTNWTESNDDASPTTGFINITGNQLQFNWLFASTESIVREANLANASSANLSFNWQTQSLDGGGNPERLVIEISSNGGATFTTLTSFVGTASGTFNQDISAFISANTVIRFQALGPNWESDDFAFVDNVQITANYNSIVSANNITVNESDGTATFSVRYTGNTIAPFSVDYSTTDNSAISGSDYITNSGTLNFSGTSGETINVVVNLIDNSYLEAVELFFLTLSNPSNLLVTTNYGIATIIDDVSDTPIPLNQPLTLFEQFNGYVDYTTTGGTFRNSDVDPCSIVTSSSGTLTSPIPATATIEKAYLQWTHSSGIPDEFITFEGQTVVADNINEAFVNINGGLTFFRMISDVTSIIEGIADPTTNIYDVADLAIDNTDNTQLYCGSGVVLGAWSLMIFYSEPTLPASSISMYNGFDPQTNNTTNYTLDGFFAIGATGSKTTVLSWEGDQGLANNELLSVTTSLGTFTLAGDGDNDGVTINNPFNSTIYDNTVGPIVNNSNIYGLDLDTYNVASFVSTGDNSITTNVGVGQDLALLNSVLLKVPGNLIVGTVYEDINYPGGVGRDLTTSSGTPIPGATVELYDNTNTLIETQITDASGEYVFGGMSNGSYSVRVVNNTVRSTRGGGSTCATCLPIQTYRTNFTASAIVNFTNEVGGANPAGQDVGTGTLTGAQTVSTVSISNEGAVGVDFGFNFNTIVNTNENGQGSLEQFIINSNNLDQTGLDIEANSIFDPASGEDTSVFMIPPTSDPLGRTADANFSGGFFSLTMTTSNLSAITGNNTHIDGRTQTAYSGDSNTGNVTPSETNVGVSVTALPSYALPEIQINGGTLGDVFTVQGNDVTIRNLAIFANGNVGIQNTAGTATNPVTITENLIGVNASGSLATRLSRGIRVSGTAITQITNNYLAQNATNAISINGGNSTTVQFNAIENNGTSTCADGIELFGNSLLVTIEFNLIHNTAAIGIEGWQFAGGANINENTISNSGLNGGLCSGAIENNGIRLYGNNSSITSNIITNSGGAGIVITGGNTSGNLISQNSIFANGTAGQALGIDIDQTTTGNPVGDGVTINDTNDLDSGPNGSINFPVFEAVSVSGNILKVIGWSRPGATLEFFITDISQGSASSGDNQLGLTQDYGEGQTFLGTAVEGSGSDSDGTTSAYSDSDGNTDNTNRFNFSITLSSPISVGTIITATATLSNATSEFSNSFTVGAATVITNRRITYRVKPTN